MSVLETVGNPDDPTSTLTKTKSGDYVDLQNIPGAKKLQLIETGDMNIDAFTTPANMPGHKLAQLRAEARERMAPILEKMEENEANTKEYKVGDFVMYNDKSYEVLKTRSDGVMIEKLGKKDNKLKKVWVKNDDVSKG